MPLEGLGMFAWRGANLMQQMLPIKIDSEDDDGA